MAPLQVTLVLLVTATLVGEAVNIPGPKFKSIGYIFSTLNTFKTNIISLISNGFKSPKKINPPVPQGNYHHILIPSPSPLVPHDISQAIFVTSPPHPGHHDHPHIETHQPSPLPIIDINIPSEVNFVQKPVILTCFNSFVATEKNSACNLNKLETNNKEI